MKKGDLVQVSKFGRPHFVGIYLGSSRFFDKKQSPSYARFLTYSGEVKDVDIGDLCAWGFQPV